MQTEPMSTGSRVSFMICSHTLKSKAVQLLLFSLVSSCAVIHVQRHRQTQIHTVSFLSYPYGSIL